jgi:hypothetical protein
VPNEVKAGKVDVSPTRQALERANGWYAAMVGAVEFGKWLRSKYREHERTFTVTLTSDDVIYQEVHDWLLDNVPLTEQKALAAHSATGVGHGSHYEIADVKSGDESYRLFLTYDSNEETTIVVNGHPVKVSLMKTSGGGSINERAWREPDKITFSARSQAGQQAVVAHLREVVAQRQSLRRRPSLWMLSQWGSWTRRMDVPLRTAESVILREDQMSRIVDDLGQFLSEESEYVRRGIPWHRGYLLQGPPGTGKTSIAKALAHAYNLDLWYAPLGDLDKDANLLSLLSEVHPRSMLLLEDIDIYHAATSREATSGQVTLSGLLNALDGVSTPHGLITILTSNEPDVLDSALVRPGRVDRIENIDCVVQEQAERLFAYFYGQPSTRAWNVTGKGLSAADLTEIFKRHLHDPAGAERTIRERTAQGMATTERRTSCL